MTTLWPAKSANKVSAVAVIKTKLMIHDYLTIKQKWGLDINWISVSDDISVLSGLRKLFNKFDF